MIGHYDREITKKPEIQLKFIVEKKANILKDSLPIELGGISQTIFPETEIARKIVIFNSLIIS